jgi:hypothetical protein
MTNGKSAFWEKAQQYPDPTRCFSLLVITIIVVNYLIAVDWDFGLVFWGFFANPYVVFFFTLACLTIYLASDCRGPARASTAWTTFSKLRLTSHSHVLSTCCSPCQNFYKSVGTEDLAWHNHSIIVYVIGYDILATFSLTLWSSTHANKVIETKLRY